MDSERIKQSMNTYLLIGSSGQLGTALQSALPSLGKVILCDRSIVDLKNLDSLESFIIKSKPTHIINASAYTKVDQAEKEPELAMQVNAQAPALMAKLSKNLNIRFIHYSTDYVFDGTQLSPYLESDPPCPVNRYGESKALGERAIIESGCDHLILRTSWVYSNHGQNFFKTILKLAQTQDELRVIDDQFGAPTSAAFLAENTIKILEKWKDQSGVYHLVPTGFTTWCGFAQAILAKESTRVLPIPTSEYPLPAKRPMNSRLSTDKISHDFGMMLEDWKSGLEQELIKHENHPALA